MFNKKTVFIALLPLTLLVSACNNNATSTDAEAVDAVQARNDIMSNWKDAMGVMGDMVKNPDKFDAAVFQEQANYLAESSDSPWTHFADSSQVGEAQEAVWSDAQGFQAEIDKFKQVTADLNASAQTATSVADIQPAFGAVGASCKSCHTGFKAD